MKPIEVLSGIPEETAIRFDKQFAGRKTLPLLWRRTQDALNKNQSGWVEGEARRRIIHSQDNYSIIEKGENGYGLGISDLYLWIQTASPASETKQYAQELHNSLSKNKWDSQLAGGVPGTFNKDGISLSYHIKDSDPHDIQAGRLFPPEYTIFEAELSGGKSVDQTIKNSPWLVLNSGIRQKDTRGNPEKISDLKKLREYFPMQVEVGCGPSTEAGIPPLHYFHQLYKVVDSSGQFIFSPKQDRLLQNLTSNILDFYTKSSVLYTKALQAGITPFYSLLKKLHNEGIVVGDIITNNLDGFCNLVGLSERNIRKYDKETLKTPVGEFDPRAKSLLIVGSHADRRHIAKAARNEGLKVIHVDPEGFTDEKGNFKPYPLEGPQTEDIHIKMTAQQFTNEWKNVFAKY